LRRPGFEADAQWIEVPQGAAAEVQTELRPVPQLAMYRQAIKQARAALAQARPGAAFTRLSRMLGVSSMVLVASERGVVRILWWQQGQWVRRLRARAPEDMAAARVLAERFISSGVELRSQPECPGGLRCRGGQRCAGGRCPVRPSSEPAFYKKWWFWTVVGALVAGGAATGALLARMERSESWRAVLRPREMP
jgi:hypothetical protein